nr:krueppel-like factor 10 [Quercus suber]
MRAVRHGGTMLHSNKFEYETAPIFDSSRTTFDGNQFESASPKSAEDWDISISSIPNDDEDSNKFPPSCWNDLSSPVSAFERYDTPTARGWLPSDSSEDGDLMCQGLPAPQISIQAALDSMQRATSNHVCSTCSASFSASHLLERHAKDSGHKSFLCSEQGCGKVYSRRDTCIRHIATHKQSSHICTICTTGTVLKAFVRKDHWLQHMRTCHSYDADVPARKHGCGQESMEKRRTTRTSLSEALRNLAIGDDLLSKIGEKYDLTRDLNTEQLTEVFAMLALMEPHRLSSATKQRLEEKIARSQSP